MLFYTAEVINKRYVISAKAQSIHNCLSHSVLQTYSNYGLIIINFEVRSNILTFLSSNRTRYSSTTVKFLEICRLSKGRVVRGARDFATLLVTCIATRVVIVKPTSSHFHQALLLFY